MAHRHASRSGGGSLLLRWADFIKRRGDPRCPVMMHFGAKDPHNGPAEIEKIRTAHPDLPLFLYDAGHGFNCDQRKDFEPESAKLARERTLEFFNRHL